MLHPAREVEVVLGTLVAVVEVVLVGMTTLVVEETSVVEVALVAAVVVADTVAVGMVIMDHLAPVSHGGWVILLSSRSSYCSPHASVRAQSLSHV